MLDAMTQTTASSTPRPTTTPPGVRPDITAIRRQFPGLASRDVLLDNAGGSQVPSCVVDAMRDYMLGSYVQVGAAYETSRRATETVKRAHTWIRQFLNGDGAGEVALGASTSILVHHLADSYAEAVGTVRQIIVAESSHESNANPFLRHAENGRMNVAMWRVDPESWRCPIETLVELLKKPTALVVFPQVSNVFGHIIDVAEVTELAHRAGARVLVDGVAYASHRCADVQKWNVDWYVYSTYKVYGPHMAALWGTHDAFAELTGPGHSIIDRASIPYKFELGGVCHEGCAGLLALRDYFAFLTGRDSAEAVDWNAVREAFAYMTELEGPMQQRLVDYVTSKPQLKLLGRPVADPSRVPTISFLHESKSSREVAEPANARGFGIRHGHFYAYRTCEALGIEPVDGVVRISLVHYNTMDEVERLIDVLDAIV